MDKWRQSNPPTFDRSSQTDNKSWHFLQLMFSKRSFHSIYFSVPFWSHSSTTTFVYRHGGLDTAFTHWWWVCIWQNLGDNSTNQDPVDELVCTFIWNWGRAASKVTIKSIDSFYLNFLYKFGVVEQYYFATVCFGSRAKALHLEYDELVTSTKRRRINERQHQLSTSSIKFGHNKKLLN